MTEHNDATDQRVSLFRKSWIRYAAAIIILLFLGVYFFTTFKKTTQTTQATAIEKADIPPGGNRATLTLASGRKITLDSASAGTVAAEPGSQVIKKADGQLEYINDKTNVKGQPLSYNTLSTPMGGQYQLTLPDGSIVWLNAASKITYPTRFAGGDRTVTVEGEVWFDVAKKSSVPFRVMVRDMSVKVLGTRFNVNAYGDEMRVSTTVLEGSVMVQSGIALEKLKAGQQANLSKQRELDVVQAADTDAVSAWKNGFISFDGHSLETNLKQLARWYNLQILFVGKMPSVQLVGKVNRHAPLSDVLSRVLNMGLKTRLELPNKLTILE